MIRKMTMHQVDAFAEVVFEGNPAAVIITDKALDDELMLQIAIENNLSETAYIVPMSDSSYDLRWFTPGGEVDLCGHATLASAYVLDKHSKSLGPFVFHTLSGDLIVNKVDVNKYLMDFPSDHAVEVDLNMDIIDALGQEPSEIYKGKDDFMVVFSRQSEVLNCKPNFSKIKKLQKRGLIITSEGMDYDFVSRCFYPAYGIDEDPVTGSAHTLLTPYWAMRLKKNVLFAKQISKRGGELKCIYKGERTALIGNAVSYMIAEISV